MRRVIHSVGGASLGSLVVFTWTFFFWAVLISYSRSRILDKLEYPLQLDYEPFIEFQGGRYTYRSPPVPLQEQDALWRQFFASKPSRDNPDLLKVKLASEDFLVFDAPASRVRKTAVAWLNLTNAAHPTLALHAPASAPHHVLKYLSKQNSNNNYYYKHISLTFKYDRFFPYAAAAKRHAVSPLMVNVAMYSGGDNRSLNQIVHLPQISTGLLQHALCKSAKSSLNLLTLLLPLEPFVDSLVLHYGWCRGLVDVHVPLIDNVLSSTHINSVLRLRFRPLHPDLGYRDWINLRLVDPKIVVGTHTHNNVFQEHFLLTSFLIAAFFATISWFLIVRCLFSILQSKPSR